MNEETKKEDTASKIDPQRVIKWAQYFAIIPLFIVMFHAFDSVQNLEAHTTEEFVKVFFATDELLQLLSFAYLATTLLVSSAYSITLLVPFFGLNDPVIAVSFAVFVSCVMYDLINGLDFPASKFGIGLFTGTLLKEKLRDISKQRG